MPSHSAPGASAYPSDPLEQVLRSLEFHPQGSLSQALAAMALDPEGPGFDRVHVLDLDARRGTLRVWSSLAPGDTPAAASRPPGGQRNEWLPDVLGGAAAEAWRVGRACESENGVHDAPWCEAPVIGAIALDAPERRVGLVVGEWREGGPDTDRRARLDRFAGRVASLLHSADRLSRERRGALHASALAEFAHAAVSAHNLAEAFHLAARLATEATASRGGALWHAGAGGSPVADVTFGIVGERERLARGLERMVAAVLEDGRARVFERVTDEPLLAPGIAAQIQSLAVLPVRAYGKVTGAIAVYDRVPRGALEPIGYGDLERAFLGTLADLVALLMEQVSRGDERLRAELQCRELGSRLAREERLAALGELVARVAEDARNPLASISAFARRVHRELPESSAHREYLEIVIRETERLERIVSAPLDQLPSDPLRLKVESLNQAVQDALREAGETLVRRRVRLLKKLAPDLPSLLIDSERVRLALSNVLHRAMENVPVGGRIRVESRRTGAFAVVEIAHDGPREPGDLLEHLFVPFSNQPAGDGLGLAVARQVIQAHGGEVRARSEAEWTAVISLTFPIHANEDRRGAPAERRQPRTDRRRRAPDD
ncbi:MAG: GAF domain-containing protein [Candidatus Eisenbacteria bacterium]|nr:GAF domain-containing protein [Candidatus Eisenbacteria bacterium]